MEGGHGRTSRWLWPDRPTLHATAGGTPQACPRGPRVPATATLNRPDVSIRRSPIDAWVHDGVRWLSNGSCSLRLNGPFPHPTQAHIPGIRGTWSSLLALKYAPQPFFIQWPTTGRGTMRWTRSSR